MTQIIGGHRVATCTSFWTGGAVVVDDGGHRVATCTYLTGGAMMLRRKREVVQQRK